MTEQEKSAIRQPERAALHLASGGTWELAARSAGGQWSTTDARVIETIDANQRWVETASVQEIAARAQVSPSTIVRVCQRLGFSGIREVKLAIARDLARDDQGTQFPESIDQLTTPQDVLATVLRHSAQSILNIEHTVDPEAFARIVTQVINARSILIIAAGSSKAPAVDMSFRLASLGLPIRHVHDSVEQHLLSAHLSPKDIAIAVSHSGRTRETLEAARTAKEAGACLCVITSFRSSPLADLADLTLVAGETEAGFRHESLVGRSPHMALVDALFVAVVRSLPDAQARSRVVTTEVHDRHGPET